MKWQLSRLGAGRGQQSRWPKNGPTGIELMEGRIQDQGTGTAKPNAESGALDVRGGRFELDSAAMGKSKRMRIGKARGMRRSQATKRWPLRGFRCRRKSWPRQSRSGTPRHGPSVQAAIGQYLRTKRKERNGGRRKASVVGWCCKGCRCRARGVSVNLSSNKGDD
ncbi:hypothetical protein BDV96DRAFT_130118 [Lophiotrema nucula]|uniref:Uncharacterized protein n=1 Tax=Lophiotrema nucula TaxID=690887 RepID=A0A6A5ZSG6_9PLEO|nr:hypothetical protein BDV96DRAFT_130118 [Lophiotrema nucula]